VARARQGTEETQRRGRGRSSHQLANRKVEFTETQVALAGPRGKLWLFWFDFVLALGLSEMKFEISRYSCP